MRGSNSLSSTHFRVLVRKIVNQVTTAPDSRPGARLDEGCRAGISVPAVASGQVTGVRATGRSSWPAPHNPRRMRSTQEATGLLRPFGSWSPAVTKPDNFHVISAVLHVLLVIRGVPTQVHNGVFGGWFGERAYLTVVSCPGVPAGRCPQVRFSSGSPVLPVPRCRQATRWSARRPLRVLSGSFLAGPRGE